MRVREMGFHGRPAAPERIPGCFTPEALEACNNQYMLQHLLGNVEDLRDVNVGKAPTGGTQRCSSASAAADAAAERGSS